MIKNKVNISEGILQALFFGLVVLVSATLIGCYDFWWHLNLGCSVFETGKLNFPDTFSYSYFGVDQFNGEWLAELIFFITYQLGGFWGLTLLKVALVLGTILQANLLQVTAN